MTTPRMRALSGRLTVDPRSDALPSKLFFRIGEVAGLVGVEPHVLRYWEREFRAIRPTKSSKGQRVYSRKDVENLLRVRALLYEEGFTIAGAKKKLARPGTVETEAATEATEGLEIEPLVAETPSVVALAETPEAPEPRVALADVAALVADGAVRASLLDLRAELEHLLSSLDDE